MTIGTVIHLFTSLAYTFLIVFYFSYLSDAKPKKSHLILLIFISAIFLVTAVSAYSSPYFRYIIIITNLLFLLATCLLYNFQKRSLFYFAVLYTVLLSAEAATIYILNLLLDTKLTPGQLNLGQRSVREIISVVFIAVSVVFVARYLKRTQKEDIPFGYWIVYFLVPLGSIYILFFINKHSESYYGTSLTAALVLLCVNILIVVAFNNMVQSFYVEIARQQLIPHIEQASREQAELMKSKMEISKVSHDLKNMLLPIRVALTSENYETAVNNLDAILEKIVSKNLPYTGITYIDCMLNYKKEICDDKGILLTVIPIMQTFLDVNYFDLSVMLGLALDNSIDACELFETREEIIVKILSKKNAFQVIISNPCQDNVKINRSGQVVTTKTNADKHGFGMKGIQQLIEKNKGYFHYNCDGNYFAVKMILYEELL